MSEDVLAGLGGVVADTTAVSDVDPRTGSLLYRGYPVAELAARCGVEEVAYLLWHGELPTPLQLAEMEGEGRAQRALADQVRVAVDLAPTTAHPMDVLRTAVSVIGATDPRADDRSTDLSKAVGLLSQLPAVIAYDQRRRRGQGLVPPRADLGLVENFLHMTFGRVPDDVVVDAFRVALVLGAEHSFCASTFTARVVTSTHADLYSAVVAAIGALSGRLHGGADESVAKVLGEIGEASRAEEWVDRASAEKRTAAGFGHDVDARVPAMRVALERLARRVGRPDLLELSDALEDAMEARAGLRPNLDHSVSLAYHLMGFDSPTFRPLVAAARVVGWTAHVMEQAAGGAVVRPLAAYVGPPERHVATTG